MSSFNKITIVGNIGHDAETRFLPSGDPVVTFNVATTERKKNKSGDFDEQTIWFRASFFGKRAEAVAPYLNKGKLVGLSGSLSQSTWTDKEGNARTTLEVKVDDLTLLGSKVMTAVATAGTVESGKEIVSNDDIPF